MNRSWTFFIFFLFTIQLEAVASEIHVAARDGNLPRVKKILQRDPSVVNDLVGGGWSPLEQAAREGHLDVAKYLIEKGADVNMSEGDADKRTPLVSAVKFGHYETVQLLLDFGVERKTSKLFEPVVVAALEGKSEVLRLLLASGFSADVSDNKGFSALYCAFVCGRAKCARLLLDAGANRDVSKGSIPLVIAPFAYFSKYNVAESKLLECLKLMSEYGFDLSVRSSEDDRLLDYAACYGLSDIAKFLLRNGADANVVNTNKEKEHGGMTPLKWSVLQNHKNVVQLLLDNGADVKQREGYSPLHVAVSGNLFDIAEILVKYGADVNCKDSEGFAPLHCLAIDFKNEKLLKLLIDNGAKVDDINTAIIAGRIDMVKSILQRKPESVGQLVYMRTPLHVAAIWNRVEIAKLLLAHGANINATCYHGYHAIHFAAQNDNVEMLEFLLENGIDKSLATATGFIPIQCASLHGGSEVVKLLAKKGVSLGIKTARGEPLMSLAVSGEHIDIIKYLQDKSHK